MSSAYLRLLIFLLAILIPACASSSPAFLMMYCAYKLNKQGDNIQPWHTSFPIWNQSVVPCPVLTVASWPAYRFLSKKVRWSDTLNLIKMNGSKAIWRKFKTTKLIELKYWIGQKVCSDFSIPSYKKKKTRMNILAKPIHHTLYTKNNSVVRKTILLSHDRGGRQTTALEDNLSLGIT